MTYIVIAYVCAHVCTRACAHVYGLVYQSIYAYFRTHAYAPLHTHVHTQDEQLNWRQQCHDCITAQIITGRCNWRAAWWEMIDV